MNPLSYLENLLTYYTSIRHNISKGIVVLNDIITQLYIMDIYRLLHLKITAYTLFSSSHRTFAKIDHILGPKMRLKWCQNHCSIKCPSLLSLLSTTKIWYPSTDMCLWRICGIHHHIPSDPGGTLPTHMYSNGQTKLGSGCGACSGMLTCSSSSHPKFRCPWKILT